QTALNGDVKGLEQFVASGWQGAWHADQRIMVTRTLAADGEVRAAGQRALNAGTVEATTAFINVGWEIAAARDAGRGASADVAEISDVQARQAAVAAASALGAAARVSDDAVAAQRA